MNIQEFAENPFTPNIDVIEGEGGLGSGKPLEKRFPGITKNEIKQRRQIQIKNAQRVYRGANRNAYNAYMNNLYHTMANEKKFIKDQEGKRFGYPTHHTETSGGVQMYNDLDEWYAHRLEEAKKANKRYREKLKNAGKWDKYEEEVKALVQKEFNAKHKKSKGRPKKGYVKPTIDWESPEIKREMEKAGKKLQEEYEAKYGKKEELKRVIPRVNGKKLIKKESLDVVGAYKVQDGENVFTPLDEPPIETKLEYWDAIKDKANKKKNLAEFKAKHYPKRKKAPPVVSEKKEEVVAEPENITMTIEETPFTPKPKKERKTRAKKEAVVKQPEEKIDYEIAESPLSQTRLFKQWKEQQSFKDQPLTNNQMEAFKKSHPFWSDQVEKEKLETEGVRSYVPSMFAPRRR